MDKFTYKIKFSQGWFIYLEYFKENEEITHNKLHLGKNGEPYWLRESHLLCYRFFQTYQQIKYNIDDLFNLMYAGVAKELKEDVSIFRKEYEEKKLKEIIPFNIMCYLNGRGPL